MAAKLTQTNIFHFLNGYPPLRLTESKTPAVFVTGLRLSDFPLVRREWDPANAQDPDTVPASLQDEVDWICAEDLSHHWRARVIMRTARTHRLPRVPTDSWGRGRLQVVPRSRETGSDPSGLGIARGSIERAGEHKPSTRSSGRAR